MAGRSNWSSPTQTRVRQPLRAKKDNTKMVQEDNIDVHVGGFLSNICLACMPVWKDAKIVNMISVCLDHDTLTTSKCNRYSFKPYALRTGSGGRVQRRR